jgi:hypothetical protein
VSNFLVVAQWYVNPNSDEEGDNEDYEDDDEDENKVTRIKLI